MPDHESALPDCESRLILFGLLPISICSKMFIRLPLCLPDNLLGELTHEVAVKGVAIGDTAARGRGDAWVSGEGYGDRWYCNAVRGRG